MKYGARIRKIDKKIRSMKKTKYECPKCGKENVVRISHGIWQCKSCGANIAGAAYKLSTTAGETIKKLTRKKQ